MKMLKISLLSFLFILFAQVSFAQSKQSFNVAGECGMCKKKIETAAKNAGATYAVWNVDSKEMTVEYGNSSSADKIQQAIASAGYDTPKFKATKEAYNKLHECCKYERATMKCCSSEHDGKMDCCADACCKDGCSKSGDSCCADGKCTKDVCCDKTKTDCCKKA